jgi:hypothetical protein
VFCQRAVHSFPFTSDDTGERIQEISIPLVESDPLNGIIAYLAQRYKRLEFPHLGPSVQTSWTPDASHQRLVSKGWFLSDDQTNQCITWELSSLGWKRARPTHYTIATEPFLDLK